MSRRPVLHPPFVLLREVLPHLARSLERELIAIGERILARQIGGLRIYGYCECGTACGTFYCVSAGESENLAGHGRAVGSLTVAKGRITRVETLDSNVHGVLTRLFPARG